MKTWNLVTFLALMLTALTSQSAMADRTYLYKETDGTLWYTNVKPANQDNTRFKLVGVYGRATATASCKGMTKARLESRANRFNDAITLYSREYKIDSKLIKAIARTESCFDDMAISVAGAQGLMQLMPATARSLGVTNAFDAEQNLRGGIRYISNLMKQYENNLAMALAAYNAGPTAVNKYRGVPPFRETQTYVEKVMKYYKEYLRTHLRG